MIAFGSYRLPPPDDATVEELRDRAKDMLARVFNLGNVVAVVGSGCTRALGYPAWEDFAREALVDVRRWLESPEAAVPRKEEQLERLSEYIEEVESAEELTSEDLMFYLGACQRIPGHQLGARPPFISYIAKRFSAAKNPHPAYNPCDALADLPIQRFITTNYDCEIERSLLKLRTRLAAEAPRFRLNRPDEVPDEQSLSFSQTDRWAHNQIRFALARELGNRDMVFHCHGRYEEAASIIASEQDYQSLYVSRSRPGGVAFLQVMELLFGSNPLLFVGYGLEEYDLMQILRQVGAADPERKHSRPIFALLPTRNSRSDEHHYSALYERYGVHVISFPYSSNLSASLCQCLSELKQHFEMARDEWFEKPPMRKPEAVGSRRLYLPNFSRRTLFRADQAPMTDRRDEIWREVTGHPACLFGIVGSAGTGKTLHALELCRMAGESDLFDKIFYWNAHYSNEALTALDILLEYLGGGRRTGESREQAVLASLRTETHLVVVDGCERLLRANGESGRGVAYGPIFRRLLGALVEGPLKSKIVFFGRLWPAEFGAPASYPGAPVRRIVLERAGAADLRSRRAFAPLTPAHRSALVSLLSGHNYGLLLAGQCLARAEIEGYGARRRFLDLQRELAPKQPQKRLEALIRTTLAELNGETEGRGGALLDLLSFFQEAVSKPTLGVCFAQAEAGLARTGSRWRLSDLLDHLVRFRLVLEIEDPRTGALSYAAHATIRQHLRSQGRSASLVPPDFALSAYAVATFGADPGPNSRLEQFERLFDHLCGEAEGLLARGRKKAARPLCRDAFGMIRAETDATAAGRWPGYNYDLYLRRGIRLAGLIKAVARAGRRWTFCEPRQLRSLESPEGVLYAGELAWLYNEVGLGLFCEGSMRDAMAVWEQGYEINRALENTEPYGEYAAHSLLNLTHTLLELGKVDESVEYLEKAARLNTRLDDDDLAGRISGYRAFYEHLRANLHEADALYQRCLRAPRKNLRALSFFLNLHAQLKLSLGDESAAASSISTSRALSLAGRYPELEALGRIAEGDFQVKRALPDLNRARHEYREAMREADRLGARALQAFTLLRLGELSLRQGDAEGGRLMSLRALKVANEFGLELMATRALIALGGAMRELGQGGVGRIYLQVAERRAETQRYELRMREAERRLQEET